MFLRALNIPGSGLTAEQYRLNLIAQNIANAETTRTESGGPYKRKVPVYQESKIEGNTFSGYLANAANTRSSGFNNPAAGSAGYITRDGLLKTNYSWHGSRAQTQANDGVKIVKVIEDPTPGKMTYDPEHPDADENGYVELPNVEMVQEMVNMMGASRSYEANVQVVNAMKAMASKALEIGR